MLVNVLGDGKPQGGLGGAVELDEVLVDGRLQGGLGGVQCR